LISLAFIEILVYYFKNKKKEGGENWKKEEKSIPGYLRVKVSEQENILFRKQSKKSILRRALDCGEQLK